MARTRHAFTPCVLTLLLTLLFAGGATQELPPNVILVIGDDHGYPYFGFTGSEHVRTPNLDLMASEGAVFHMGHVTANHCRPSLQTLVTGLYPLQYSVRADSLLARYRRTDAAYAQASATGRIRLETRFRDHAMQHFTTLPTLLAGAGYASFQGGKWWEYSYVNGGFTEGMTEGWQPDERGRPGWFRQLMGGSGLSLARQSLQPVFDFIDRNAERPFFLWYAPTLPHTPLNPPFTHYKFYAGTSLSASAKEYYGNCTWFDAGVGSLLDYLHEKGLRQRTIMIYVNDNGWEQPPFAEYKDDPELYANGGEKGKLSLHDLAFRTPIIFHWPRKITPRTLEHDLVSTVDLVPTILDYAGLEVPAHLPGRSLRPVIEGNARSGREHLIGRTTVIRDKNDVMGRHADGYYLRTTRWHYFEVDGRAELYDMQSDPSATINVVAEHGELASRFREAIRSWRKETLSSLD